MKARMATILLHAIYERIVVAAGRSSGHGLRPLPVPAGSPWRFQKRLDWRARQVLDTR
jgi:hypothetical protein